MHTGGRTFVGAAPVAGATGLPTNQPARSTTTSLPPNDLTPIPDEERGTIARFAAVSPLTPAFTVLDSGTGVRAACAVRKPHAWAPTRVTLTTTDDAPVDRNRDLDLAVRPDRIACTRVDEALRRVGGDEQALRRLGR